MRTKRELKNNDTFSTTIVKKCKRQNVLISVKMVLFQYRLKECFLLLNYYIVNKEIN